ncbi:MAG: M36 family metallopeptidase [Piscinibacter sp.]|nr:M36 family metallopeptidase [Piscinibacter sp.]
MLRPITAGPIRQAGLALAVTLAMSGSSWSQDLGSGYHRAEAAVYRAESGSALASALMNRAQATATVLRSNGRDLATLAALVDAGSAAGRNGVTHQRYEQVVAGLPVYGAYAKAAFDRNGQLVHLIDHLAAVPTQALAAPRTSALDALRAAMAQVHPGEQAQFRSMGRSGRTESFDGGGFFFNPPTVSAVVIPLDDGSMSQGWLVQTWTRRDNLLDHTLVGGNGRVLNVERRTANDSYNVFVDDPLRGAQTPVNGPGAGNAQSPAGWLSGAQSTINIQGNNTRTYLDTDANNAPDAGGTPVTDGRFLTAVDLFSTPKTTGNRAVAVQNLFYLTNTIHDILYGHGFDEAHRNFQANNFGNGGLGNDPVLAEAQDGSGTDNANFATPNDGSSPRMQMYLWSGAGPNAFVTTGGADYGAWSSTFGSAVTLAGVAAPLAVYTDAGGISATDGCEASVASLTGKLAIVDRGNCNFTVKVVNAQRAGAVGVIIVNNVPGNGFSPGGTDRKIKIPSAMVSQTDGSTLRNLAALSQGASLRKNPVDPLQIDGDLDASIVYHEYGHGLTWRMIGGMSGPLAGAIGEGASDVNAFMVLGRPIMGDFAFSNPAGIRRDSYEGYPRTYGAVDGGEVHDDGEIYAAAMWKVRQNYLAAGLTSVDAHGDFVQGMNFTPATPTFENMRDGMLQAVAGTGRECLVWRGFAAQGIGVGAKGTVSRRGKVTITESFALPSSCP